MQLPGARGKGGDSFCKEEKITLIYDCWNRAHNTGINLTLAQLAKQCHLLPRTIRQLCPELVRQCYSQEEKQRKCVEKALSKVFAEIEQSNEEKSAKYLASRVGIAEMTLHSGYHHWKTLLYEHNKRVISLRLQVAWDRMESLNEIWSFRHFAKEAGIAFEDTSDSVRRLDRASSNEM